MSYPKFLKPAAQLEYLKDVHGIEYTAKSLANKRCTGLGPPCRYLGNVPLSTPAEIDLWAATLLTDRPANGRKRFAAPDGEPKAA